MRDSREAQSLSELVSLYMHALTTYTELHYYIDALVQERHNSSALAMELHLSCINPSIS